MFQREVVQKIKTHISCPVSPSPKKSAIYEKMWNNIVELGGPQMTVWCIWLNVWYLWLKIHTQNM